MNWIKPGSEHFISLDEEPSVGRRRLVIAFATVWGLIVGTFAMRASLHVGLPPNAFSVFAYVCLWGFAVVPTAMLLREGLTRCWTEITDQDVTGFVQCLGFRKTRYRLTRAEIESVAFSRIREDGHGDGEFCYELLLRTHNGGGAAVPLCVARDVDHAREVHPRVLALCEQIAAMLGARVAKAEELGLVD